MNIRILFLSSALLLTLLSSGQTGGVGINSTGNPPDPSAMLDVQSTAQGVLFPRLTTLQRNQISSPAQSLVIFNTTSGCLEMYLGTSWQSMFCGCSGAPAVPGAITGNASPACNAAGISYSVAAVPGATSYQWTVPSGATVVSGAGTNAIAVNFGTASGQVCATTSNSCGTSPSTCLNVSVGCYTPGSQTFHYTGSSQSFTVPAGVTSLTVDARGAQGGAGQGNSAGAAGKGGRVQTTLSVTPGETLTLFVGGAGAAGGSGGGGGAGGFNGGGNGGNGAMVNGAFNHAGGGGGASDIRQGGTGVAQRVAVAGGGGGGGGAANPNNPDGGDGGNATGENGTSGGGWSCCSVGGGGGGGTSSSGGAGGSTTYPPAGAAGALAVGGSGATSDTYGGGGGGGGYYGGGGGAASNNNGAGGGGGGSSFSAGSGTIHTQGYQSGHGQIILSW